MPPESEFSQCGIALDANGAFTRIDHEMMSESELLQRKDIVEERIREYEEELGVICEVLGA